MLLDSQLRI